MDNKTILDFKNRVGRELNEDILPFWLERSLDGKNGGFIGRMANDLTVIEDAPKGLILNARLLWTFSSVFRWNCDFRCLELAQRAYEYFVRFFWDGEYGGAFWLLDAQGRCLDDKKKIYGQAFCVYALSEFSQAFRCEAALQRAQNIYRLIEEYSHDEEGLGYFETCNRDWTLAEDCRLSDKDMNEKKSMNNHLHLLEAYANLYRVWKEDSLRRRLLELIDIFQQKIFDPAQAHFRHFFNERWIPQSASYTFGHDIEGSWLLWKAVEALGDKSLEPKVRKMALSLADAVFSQGFDADGGLFYEGERETIIDHNKEWWPQAEAVVGLLNAYQLSSEDKYFHTARKCWDFIENRIVDRQRGEWFWRVSREGTPDESEPKVSEWKGPYHNTRACLEILRRLQRIGKGIEP
ncbi:MAG: AGE family epimerase/isomerase [Candidatus Omnitrophota bacterium]